MNSCLEGTLQVPRLVGLIALLKCIRGLGESDIFSGLKSLSSVPGTLSFQENKGQEAHVDNAERSGKHLQ